MIFPWEIFFRTNASQFRETIANMPKKTYPTSVEGLVKIGLDLDMGRELSVLIAEMGLKERVAVCLFIHYYARYVHLERFKGKVALESYLERLKLDLSLHQAMSEWTKGALAAANTPSSKVPA